MTRPVSLIPLLFASALIAVAPTLAAGPDERAVSQCRAELLSQFPQGAIRDYRVASIEGTSRRTRVTFAVSAERRYRFECSTGRDGQILLTSFEPTRSGDRLAAGRR
ncbi:MAG: hypothetical protein M3177_05720 [Pseudomonadota bacterium]|nr:hypothetical protein [Pseudomonadota bacterium]